MQRRALLAAAAGALIGCGGPTSKLHVLGAPKGSGPIDFQVENRTDVVVNNLYVASTDAVRAAPRAAFESGSAEQQALWGDDRLLGSGLEPGGKLRLRLDSPGRYDIRVVDRDGREQHVAGLSIEAGGRYVLELGEGGWRVPR